MKKVFLAAFIVSATTSFGQNVELAKSQLSVNLLPLTLSFEGKIDDNKSLTLAGGLGYTAWYSDSGYGSSESVFIVVPIVYGGFRNYYARNNIRKDNLRNNSGNYFGLFASYQLEALGTASSFNELIAFLETSNVYTVGPVWGIERNYASGIHLGLSMGVGVIGGKYIETTGGFIGEFELGILLFQRQ